jgi:hypothetical protein
MRQGNSWSTLTGSGGQSFVEKFAELHFIIQLNSIPGALRMYADMLRDLTLRQFAANLIRGHIAEAEKSMIPGHWKENYTFQPSDAHLAKFRYRQAHYLRLISNTHLSESFIALQYIKEALALCPGDVMILKERRVICDWVNHGHV